MVQLVQSRTERPAAIVCIAYRQLSIMTGIKDPTEPPKVEPLNQEDERMNAIVKRSLANLTNISMEDFFQFSRDMTDSFRLMLNNLRLRFEEFREENQSIFDLFSIEQLQKWTQREQ